MTETANVYLPRFIKKRKKNLKFSIHSSHSRLPLGKIRHLNSYERNVLVSDAPLYTVSTQRAADIDISAE